MQLSLRGKLHSIEPASSGRCLSLLVVVGGIGSGIHDLIPVGCICASVKAVSWLCIVVVWHWFSLQL